MASRPQGPSGSGGSHSVADLGTAQRGWGCGAHTGLGVSQVHTLPPASPCPGLEDSSHMVSSPCPEPRPPCPWGQFCLLDRWWGRERVASVLWGESCHPFGADSPDLVEGIRQGRRVRRDPWASPGPRWHWDLAGVLSLREKNPAAKGTALGVPIPAGPGHSVPFLQSVLQCWGSGCGP